MAALAWPEMPPRAPATRHNTAAPRPGRSRPSQKPLTWPQTCQSWWRWWSHPWPPVHHPTPPAREEKQGAGKPSAWDRRLGSRSPAAAPGQGWTVPLAPSRKSEPDLTAPACPSPPGNTPSNRRGPLLHRSLTHPGVSQATWNRGDDHLHPSLPQGNRSQSGCAEAANVACIQEGPQKQGSCGRLLPPH